MKKYLYICIASVVFVGFLSIDTSLVSASSHDPFGDGFKELGNQLGSGSGMTQSDKTEEAVLKKVINWLLSFVAILSLLAIIVGGIMYIISFGNESRVATAKKILLYAIIGIIVVGLSFTILFAIERLFVTGNI